MKVFFLYKFYKCFCNCRNLYSIKKYLYKFKLINNFIEIERKNLKAFQELRTPGDLKFEKGFILKTEEPYSS